MKSRGVKRFLAILGACAIVITSMPFSVQAAETVSSNAVSDPTEDDAVTETTKKAAATGSPASGESAGATTTPSAVPSGSPESTAEPSSTKEPVETSTPDAAATQTPDNLAGNKSDIINAITKSASDNVISVVGATPSTVPTSGDEQTVLSDDTTDEQSGVGGADAIVPGTPTISSDSESGLNIYNPVISEFATTKDGEGLLVTRFTPSLSQSYDLVLAPGVLNGKKASYGVDFLKSVSKDSKGVVFGNGSTLVTSAQDLKIPYIRFDDGAKTNLSSQVFKGWSRLSTIVGYGEALVSAGASDVSFGETFSGCTELRNVELNLEGLTASFDGTFNGIDNIGTIRINGCSITSIRNLNNSDCDPQYLSVGGHNGKTVTFSNVTFPSNDTAYLSHAFTNMRGSLLFTNCTSDGSNALNFDEAYAGSNLCTYKKDYDVASGVSLEPGTSYGRTDINVSVDGATAYSARGMFEGSQLKDVTLQNFITADTVAVDSMFKGATVAGINGVDTWRLGGATADEMFFNTRVYFGPNAYLTKTLIPSIKRLNWSGVTSANKLFKFVYKADCPIDYSGMDLSGVTEMIVSDLQNYDFITPAKNPQSFVFERDSVYRLRTGSTLGGKALDTITVTGGKVSGTDIPMNTHVYTDIATISITDVSTGTEVSTAVVPGYNLSEYLDSTVSYYQDSSLTQAVAGDLKINGGDRVSVYCNLSGGEITEDVMEGADIDLGSNLSNVTIKFEDGSTDKLQGGNADVSVTIKGRASDSSAVIPNEGKKYKKSAFFNVDLVATVGGANKKVTELSKKATVTLPLPADYKSGDVMVLNYHDGLDKAPIVIAGTVNPTAKTVSFGTDKFSPYVLLYDEGTITYTTKEVLVDLSALSTSDFSSLVGKDLLVSLFFSFENGSEVFLQENLTVGSGTYKYKIEYEVGNTDATGSKFKKFTNISTLLTCKGNYESVVNLDTMTLSFVPVAEDSKETTNYNFAVKVVDNNNATKTRPETLEIKFTAKYDTYSRDKIVNINLKGVSGNVANGTVQFPNTVGGKTMTSLEATTTTGTNIGYSSTWDNANKLFKYMLAGATDTDPDPGVVIDPGRVECTFVGDVSTSRPSSIVITLVDSKGGNTVVKNLNTAFSPTTNYYSDAFERLVNDTYHVASVSGIDATKYNVTYNGLSITATYKTGNSGSTTATRKITIEMDDNNDEAGMRPKSMKVKIANNSGTWSSTNEITVGSSNSFTYEVSVPDASGDYKISGVEGLPDGYKTEINGFTIKCKYTPEKIQKTFKVAWEGDADNADKTRPGSVSLTVKNGSNTVQTVSVSEDTNWAANVSLNKMLKGVEANYTLEGADVTNYSKSVSGDTITYKFTGTLSKDAAAIQANKDGGKTNSTSLEGNELSYDITNFDWIDYANKYPDLKKAYGYNKEALYAHYIRYGIGEGRIATFTGKYATVNEDVLKAYFPEDYKYKTNLPAANEEYLIGSDKTQSGTSSGSASENGNKVTVDKDGNVHTTVKNADGTTTETVTDKDGNIISVSTYKTGDLRVEDLSIPFIILGVLLLLMAAMIVRVVVRDEKRKKSVLSMIS